MKTVGCGELANRINRDRKTSMKIRIGVVGEILTGDEAGLFVKIEDDREGSTGGFYILTAKDRDIKDGFDNWVVDEDSLRKYFDEAQWTIRWL